MNWNGSDIGEINHLIKSCELEGNYYLVTFIDNQQAYIFNFENSLPLIADELKPLFGLPKVGRHKCLINNKKILLCRKLGEETPFEESGNFFLTELQRIFIFRWALGFTLTSTLRMRKLKSGVVSIISYQENSINYDKNNNRRSHIPDIYLKKWFKNEDVENVVKTIFTYEDFNRLRFKIDETIRNIDKEYVWWNSNIMERLGNKFS
jgi:hypothetical protein